MRLVVLKTALSGSQYEPPALPDSRDRPPKSITTQKSKYMELFLIVFQTFICLLGIIYLLSRDLFLTIFFLMLWVYTIFTQLGYVYYPTVITQFGIGGGEDLFYKYWFFVTFSLIFVFLGMYLLTYKKALVKFYVVQWRMQFKIVSVFLLTVPFLYFFYRIISEMKDLNYIGITSSGETNILFSAFYSILGIFLFALWARFRSNSLNPTDKVMTIGLILIYGSIYLWYGIKTGDRSSLMGMFLGLSMYEMMPLHKNLMQHKMKTIGSGIFLLLFIFFLQHIASVRGYGEISLNDILNYKDAGITKYSLNSFKSLIFQDYFSPSLLLIASQDIGFVDPAEVLRSNFYNSLILFKYPTLSQTVGAFIGNTSRTQGFAYYILTEGYNFIGYNGIIYNGILITLGLALWRNFAQSNNYAYNRYMYGLMTTRILQLVRAQTCYLIKDVYLVLIPGMLIYFFICNQKPVFKQRKK